jgi:CHAT domain-containing protein
MMAGHDAVAVSAEVIERLAQLSDADRQQYLARHPELCAVPAVRRLAGAVIEQIGVDLQRAGRLAKTVFWLAERSEDPGCLGLANKSLGHVEYLGGRYEAAIAHYEAATEVFRAAGAQLDAVDCLSSSLQALILMGRYVDATSCAEQARSILAVHPDDLRLARLECNVGNIHHRQEEFEAAMHHYEVALEGLRRQEPGVPREVAAALHNIAVCQISRFDLDAALDAYTEVRAICDEHELPLIRTQADYNIAYLYFHRGEYQRAIELYRGARARAGEANDRYHLALCDLDMAELYLELSLFGEARRLSEAALDQFSVLNMGYETAKAVVFLAVACNGMGMSLRALELFDDAQDRFRGEGTRTWAARIDLYRALILYEQHRLPEARRLANRAREFFESSGQHSKAAYSELLLSRIELQAQDTAAALATCWTALEKIQHLQLSALSYQVHFLLGEIYEAMGSRSASIREYREAHRHVEGLRGQLGGEELKVAFLENKLDVYESLTWMTLRESPSKDDLRAAFSYIEQAKSRSLVELIRSPVSHLRRTGSAGGALLDEMRGLREKLSWCYRQIDFQELEGAPQERISELRRQTQRCEQQLFAAHRKLRDEDFELSSLASAEVLGIEVIRAGLPRDALLLEYFQARGTVFACVLTQDAFEILPVTRTARVDELQRRLQFQLSKYRLGPEYLSVFGDQVQEATTNHLRALYDELVAPVRDRLRAQHLIIVPDGPLHYLPYHALHDGASSVLDQYAVSYAQSATVFTVCTSRRMEVLERSLVLGVGDDATPAIREEVDAVAKVVPDPDVYVGAAATAETLRQSGAGRRFVHIATHGFFREDNPMFSAIQLGDSRLTVLDLYGLDLRSDLVVLSGCGTGLNVIKTGNELLGLTRGLLHAGATSVLATLWDVHDRSTAELMTLFYTALQREPNYAYALREAMLELRTSYPYPYHWAPFILVGRPSARGRPVHPTTQLV